MRIVEIPALYIDEYHDLIGLLRVSYNWAEHFPYIKIIDRTVEYTNKYKGKEGDEHLVVRNVKLELRDDTPDIIVQSLEKILEKCEDYRETN